MDYTAKEIYRMDIEINRVLRENVPEYKCDYKYCKDCKNYDVEDELCRLDK